MELLAQYSDDEAEEAPAAAPRPTRGALPKALAAPGARPEARASDQSSALSLSLPAVNGAPDVDLLGMDKVQNFALNTADKRMLTNPSVAAMHKPLQGPVAVGQKTMEMKLGNHKMGHVEKLSMNQFAFDQQYQTFQNYGYAANPARNITPGTEILQTTEVSAQLGKTIFDKGRKRQRIEASEYYGDDRMAKVGPGGAEMDIGDSLERNEGDADNKWGGFADESDVRKVLDEQVKMQADEKAREAEEEKAVQPEDPETKERITSVFHGAKETDYAGRSWIENKGPKPKSGIDDRSCYLPKKWIYTWSGHTMGVQQIRWFPETAHLILSAGMDAKVKIWDYNNQRKCLRTYMGHDQAVRDVNFTSDGRRFYSCSYDKNIQYWDTETGQVISTFTNKKTPFCVSVHPDPSQQNIICCGCSNKKAVQWDANTSTIVQEYDEHLGAVNTVTFCEDGKRLLTTADDKKIFLWEYGIPVVVKHIAEPTMHSVPAVCLGPKRDKQYLLGQSMDNKIICYEAFGRFKFQGKKTFKGHMNSGYAITPGWSPDGHWIMSGDADGKLWFWDWQKMKNFRVLKAHDGVCMSCIWHPTQTSRVVSCGWDGAIKLWD
mmetsp:Transcript_4480/g.10399  ORF Transcript_4480/g.10399 Transcript_4480/m.10399 type:complete len:603 (+) Transcript_4480:54-1862(+)